MHLRSVPEDLDADPLSIGLEHLDLTCHATGVAEVETPIVHVLERGRAQLHFVIRGRVEMRIRRERIEDERQEEGVLEAGDGVVVTGPATYGLQAARSTEDPGSPTACELLLGRVAYSAMEFPPERRFLPDVWGGPLSSSRGGPLCAERYRDLLREIERRRPLRDPCWFLVGQYVAVELGRAHLGGPAARATPLGAALGDAQLGPLMGLLIRTLAHRWDVEDLAQRLAVGRKAFASRVRDVSTLSPFELLKVLRMQRTSRHLATLGIALKEIPALVGYRSLSALSSAFGKVGGMTLAESRQLALSRVHDAGREG